MSPRRYLADTAAAAAAVNAFSEALEGVGPEARAGTLRRVAPRLEDPLETTAAVATRLAAARLQDARLEAQRRRAAPALAAVVAAMSRVVTAARSGDPQSAEEASRAFTAAIGDLRRLPVPR